jgi:hypothetical protein
MPESDTRLKIQAFEKADYSGSPVKEFLVMFNPDGYSKKFEAEYEAAQGQGSSNSPQVFKRIKPREISLEFLIDGTNAAKTLDTASVEEKVDQFRKTCIDLVGTTHRPYYLYVVWGDLFLYCILKSADVKYSLFNKEGKALRAKISASFAENEADATREKREKKSSPDLTHLRVVKAGDTLPLMCYQIYGDSSWYPQVAAVNGLKNYRKLEPGTQLVFPPIDKTAATT